MWSTSAGGQLMKVVNLTGFFCTSIFVVETIIRLCSELIPFSHNFYA